MKELKKELRRELRREDFTEFHDKGYVPVLRYIVNDDYWITIYADDDFWVTIWKREEGKPVDLTSFKNMSGVETRRYNCLRLSLIYANKRNKELQ